LNTKLPSSLRVKIPCTSCGICVVS
jgi:hypothetical protein